jgi:hypothetical protein
MVSSPAGGAPIAQTIVNQNLLPRPGSLSTPMRPPIRPVSCFEMASPSPVPPNLRVVMESAWLNLANSRS